MAALHEIVIATGNPHKVEEIGAILAAALPDLVARGLPDDPGPEPIEDGATFEANALIKARTYAQRLGVVCLADDSGLEVDALEGAPGVYSARYAGSEHEGFDAKPRSERDALNNQKLLAALQDAQDAQAERRTARFVCAIAVCAPDGSVLAETRGHFEGRIGTPPDVPRGENGFGYDPLFLVAPEHAVTSAELEPAEKNRQSHRARACAQLVEQLKTLR